MQKKEMVNKEKPILFLVVEFKRVEVRNEI